MATKKKTRKKRTEKQLPIKALTNVGYSVVLNDKNTYDLVTINFDVESKQAKVTKIEHFADEQYQAIYKIKVLMAEKKFIPNK